MMTKSLAALAGMVLIGLSSLSFPGLAQHKSVRACREEWRANKAPLQANGITEKAYVADCRAVGTTAKPDTATAAPTTPAQGAGTEKTIKACQEEWRAKRATGEVTGVPEKAYVEQCYTGNTTAAPSPTGTPPAPAAIANQTSPLGINLGGVTYYTPEQPFLNAFKTGSLWYTQNSTKWDTGEQSKLDLDSNGWVKTLTGVGGQAVSFTKVGILLLGELPAPYYPGGQYVVLYEGQGSLVYSFDGKKDLRASSPGRDVLNVTPSAAGILIQITATDPNQTGNYIRNIRLVKADQEAILQSGDIFNSSFLDRIKSFRVLRFMDWMGTNNSLQSTWSDRPVQSRAFYGDLGVPLEIMAALSNKLIADPWFNMPHMATDDYITQFATKARSLLTKNQKVYIEYSNETWNFIFSQATYMTNQGKAMWSFITVTDFEKNRSWFGMRTAQVCDIWKKVWGTDADRVICVMASQAANPWVSKASLNCPLWSGAPCSSNHGINALAIAPYFGGRGVPSSWTSQPD